MANTTKGRAVPPLPEFTFQDSGVTVRLRKVSPLLRDDIETDLRRRFPPPAVPVVEMQVGDETVREENPADPDYKRKVMEWAQEHALRYGEAWLRTVIDLGVEVEVDADAVAALRAYMARRGQELDDDDKYVYVRYLCITTNEELQELRAAVSRRSLPTREAVDAHKATFRGDAQGA